MRRVPLLEPRSGLRERRVGVRPRRGAGVAHQCRAGLADRRRGPLGLAHRARLGRPHPRAERVQRRADFARVRLAGVGRSLHVRCGLASDRRKRVAGLFRARRVGRGPRRLGRGEPRLERGHALLRVVPAGLQLEPQALLGGAHLPAGLAAGECLHQPQLVGHNLVLLVVRQYLGGHGRARLHHLRVFDVRAAHLGYGAQERGRGGQ